jgi:hypothetical protein
MPLVVLSRRCIVRSVLAALLLAGCATPDAPSAPEPPKAGVVDNVPSGGSQDGELFYQWQFEQKPFDPALEKWKDGTVAELMDTLETSPDESKRWLAAAGIGECCFGGSFRGMRFCWPSREDRQAMIAAVEQGRAGTKARVLVPVLARALDDPSRKVREAIAYSFVHIGPVGAEAVPALRAALGDEDTCVRLWVARALHGITLETDLPLETNLSAFDDADPKMREMAVYNLELMVQDARVALAHLQRLADSDPDEDVRSQARQAVASLRQ